MFFKEEVYFYFLRLKCCGYNIICYVFIWEVIEVVGLGIYDEEWIDNMIGVLCVVRDYGFYIFMDFY